MIVNIFENTAKRANQYYEIQDANFGISAWNSYLHDHNFYYITFDKILDNQIELFPSLANVNIQHYLNSKEFYEKRGVTQECFIQQARQEHEYLKKYDTSFFDILHNTLFMAKMFNQLSYLTKEIYKKGYYNYPTLYFEDNSNMLHYKIYVHPGQHLYWVKMFLKLDTCSFFSVHKKHLNIFNDLINKNIIHIIKELSNSNDIYDIFKKKNIRSEDINGFVCQEGNSVVPTINCTIPNDTEWSKFEENGLNLWPWQKVNLLHEWVLTQPWVSIFTKNEDPNRYVLIKNHFTDKTKMLNNLYAFLLLNINEDLNFRRK
ncbi:MAG: hypothetical protein CO117_03890 [Flavobacteriaceae bacterium CG_4_9_14_3_um_filter_33_16]|nr:MAG: hypothetical protein CO117_03890 [Flavobacteriaceae bacterium CG_4_9_14_3_um_filter_33_16]